MIFKLTKGLLFSLILTISTFSNAAVLLFDFQSSDTTLNYQWTIDTSQGPLATFPFGILHAIELTTALDNVVTVVNAFVGFTDIGTVFPPPSSRISAGGFDLILDLDARAIFTATGPKLFDGEPSATPEYTLGQFDMFFDVFAPIPSENGSLTISEVSAPSAIAAFTLGLLGLASQRRINKQS